MNRRDFVAEAVGAFALTMSGLARSDVRPCPPPLLRADGRQISTDCTESALQRSASALTPGQSTTGLGDIGLEYEARYAVQWMNRFFYDAPRRRAYLLGKKESGADGSGHAGYYWAMRYDERSNSWVYAPSFIGSDFPYEKGHVYESLAFDSGTAELYTAYYPGAEGDLPNRLKRLACDQTLTTWSSPATAPHATRLNDANQTALCWHPNLFGADDGGVLAIHNYNSFDTKIIAWRKRTGTWYSFDETLTTMIRPADASYRVADGAIEYVRGGDFCIAALPPGESLGKSWRINAGSGGALARAIQIADVPMRCGHIGGGGRKAGVLVDDPLGAPTPYILEKGGENRVWKFDGKDWVLKRYAHPFPTGVADGSHAWAVTCCFPLGVFWSIERGGTSLIWRPND